MSEPLSKFRFKLSALLKLREMEENRAKQTFHEAQKSYRDTQLELEAIVRDREEAKNRCRNPDDGVQSLDIDSLLRERRYINVLYQRILGKGEELRRRGASLLDAKKKLAEATTRLKLVEKLRERQRRAFELESNRQEIRVNDEIGQNYNRLRSLDEARS